MKANIYIYICVDFGLNMAKLRNWGFWSLGFEVKLPSLRPKTSRIDDLRDVAA